MHACVHGISCANLEKLNADILVRRPSNKLADIPVEILFLVLYGEWLLFLRYNYQFLLYPPIYVTTSLKLYNLSLGEIKPILSISFNSKQEHSQKFSADLIYKSIKLV